MNKLWLLSFAALFTTTICMGGEPENIKPVQLPPSFPSMTTDAVRDVANILDAEKIGSIRGIYCDSPGKITVLSNQRLDTDDPNLNGAFIEFENVGGVWTLMEKMPFQMR